MKRINVSLLSGLTIGIAGFTADLFSNSAIFRLIFIILGTLPLFIILPKKTIEKKYNLSVVLFSLYIALYIFSSYLNETSIDLIFRELILYYVIIFIFILINYEDYFSNYLKGIFISLILLNIYYFFHINLGEIFHPFYRFSLNLNSIGISYLAISLVIMSLFYNQSKENKNILLWILISIGMIILLATKSRTVVFLAILAILIFNYHRLNKKWFIFFSLIFVYFLINSTEYFLEIFRLTDKLQSGGADINSFSGRTFIWSHAIEIIKNNIFFGVGVENAYFRFDFGSNLDFHNAYLHILGTVGVIGFLPIFIILIISIYNSIFYRKLYLLFTIFIIVGIIGGITESRLLNYGSPANLLILISIIKLSFLGKDKCATSN